MGSFEPGFLTIARGTPVSSVLPAGVDPAGDRGLGGGWYDLGDGWYAVANAVFGTEDDPGLVAFAWVRRPGVVDMVLRRADPVGGGEPEHPEPDPALVGFAPLTYAEALRHEKAAGGRPMRSASYRMTDGAFVCSRLAGDRREYYFAAANPRDHDEAIGVQFRLA